MKITQETRFTAVIMIGRMFTERPAMVSNPSGLPKSAIGPKETPFKSESVERNW